MQCQQAKGVDLHQKQRDQVVISSIKWKDSMASVVEARGPRVCTSFYMDIIDGRIKFYFFLMVISNKRASVNKIYNR